MDILRSTINTSIDELQDFWPELFGQTSAPPRHQFGLWLIRFGYDVAKQGLADAALKYQRLSGQMSTEYIGKYASAAMARIAEEKMYEPTAKS
jgi:hypothetical protein